MAHWPHNFILQYIGSKAIKCFEYNVALTVITSLLISYMIKLQVIIPIDILRAANHLLNLMRVCCQNE